MASPPDHEIVFVPNVGQPGRDVLRQQCYDIRIAVFVREQGFPEECEITALDEDATHILLRLVPSLRPVGTVRYTATADGCRLGAIAILGEYRGFGFGRELVRVHHDHVRVQARAAEVQGPVKVFLHAQLHARGFYTKFGYQPEGEPFEEDGAPHQLMVTHLMLE